MTDPHDQYPHHPLWRPYVPSPYVTHQDLGPLHNKVGALEKGQESILQAFAGYRAEMLTRVDRSEAAIMQRIDALEEHMSEAKAAAGDKGITMGWREFALVAAALVLAGIILDRMLPSFAQSIGG